jgi:hypothetical protein
MGAAVALIGIDPYRHWSRNDMTSWARPIATNDIGPPNANREESQRDGARG